MHVPIDENMAGSDKHDVFLKAAASLQAFYDSKHNLEKNICNRKRGHGSCADDDASTESTHGEPVQKALK